MPYFVYKVFPNKKVEEINSFGAYREARQFARDRREALTESDDYFVKVIFAGNADEAKRLLVTEREPRPLGEDA